MDYTNPYHHSSNFMELLHSQTIVLVLNPFLMIVSPLVYQRDHQMCLCLVDQCTDDPILCEETVGDRRGRRKWTPGDDVVLISAWLDISKDDVVANEQKSGTFWKRIAAFFAASPQVVSGDMPEPSHCKQRWQKINDQVCKFSRSYEAANREKSSGQNENDVLKIAHQIFFTDHKKKFTLEYAWKELRHDQKWCALFMAKTDGGSKKRKCGDGEQSSSSHTVTSVGDQANKSSSSSHVDFTYSTDMRINLGNMMDTRTRIRDRQMHQRLKDDLVDHIWQKFGHFQ